MASTFINALAPHVRDTARIGIRWAGPRVASAGVKFVGASHAARDFVRELAEEKFDALTESEYLGVTNGQRATMMDLQAEETHDLIALDDDNDGRFKGVVQSTGDGEGWDASMEPRGIILHCRNMRVSRNLGHIEAIGGLLPQLSHWCVEVCGSFY